MLEGKPTPAGSGHAAAGYSYLGDLARFVRERWRNVPKPPDAAALEGFFAACYQASMLREEERPVTFRVLLAEVPADAQTVCRSLRMSSNNMTNCKRKKMTGSTLGCPGGRTVGTPAL
jgi:hypothetical protein